MQDVREIEFSDTGSNASNKICFEVRATALRLRLQKEGFPLHPHRIFHKGTTTEELQLYTWSTLLLSQMQPLLHKRDKVQSQTTITSTQEGQGTNLNHNHLYRRGIGTKPNHNHLYTRGIDTKPKRKHNHLYTRGMGTKPKLNPNHLYTRGIGTNPKLNHNHQSSTTITSTQEG